MFNMFKSKHEDNLKKHIDDVKLMFNAVNVGHIQFYIAGGSVYSILNDSNNYEDVDIFFYNDKDASDVIDALTSAYDQYKPDVGISQLISKHVTTNALTLDKSAWNALFNLKIDTKFQFITKFTGSIEHMFTTFDLNASCFAYDSNYVLTKGAELTYNIEVNFNNFGSDTMTRYKRYILEKGCIDKDNVQLFKIFDHLVNNFYEIIPGLMYGDAVSGKITGLTLLAIHLNGLGDCDQKYIYNSICNKFKDQELIEAFKDFAFDFVFDDVNTEYIVYYLDTHETFDDKDDWSYVLSGQRDQNFSAEQIKLAHSTYPEYFI